MGLRASPWKPSVREPQELKLGGQQIQVFFFNEDNYITSATYEKSTRGISVRYEA